MLKTTGMHEEEGKEEGGREREGREFTYRTLPPKDTTLSFLGEVRPSLCESPSDMLASTSSCMLSSASLYLLCCVLV